MREGSGGGVDDVVGIWGRAEIVGGGGVIVGVTDGGGVDSAALVAVDVQVVCGT